MKVETMFAVRPGRHEKMFLGGVVALASVATLLLAPAAAHAGDPGGPGQAGKNPAMRLESVPGSKVPRVILSAKAAQRLGIETGQVGEELVVHKQMVSGLIIPPMEKQPDAKPGGGLFGGFGRLVAAPAPKPASGTFGGFAKVAATPALQPVALQATSPAAAPVWVLVSLSPGEWDRLAKDRPARLLPLATRGKLGSELLAQPSGMQPVEDMKRSMLTLFYVVPGKDHGLAVNNRMRVELQLSGGDEKQKVVPYSAVYYDAKGTAWVYVNPKPLVFERQRIGVERVVGDQALLNEGPSVGTHVVTVGAALLYGAELFKK